MIALILLHACEQEPGACPEPDERYVPGVPADACVETEEECRTSTDIECPGGAEYDEGLHVFLDCSPEICASGYLCEDGLQPKCGGGPNGYCDTRERLDEWANASCPGCDIDCYRTDEIGAVNNPSYCRIRCDPTK